MRSKIISVYYENIIVVFLGILVFSEFGCTQKVDTQADIEAIKKTGDITVKAFAENDIELMLSIHTDDIISIPPNGPTTIGMEALRSWLQFMKQDKLDITNPAYEIQVWRQNSFGRSRAIQNQSYQCCIELFRRAETQSPDR